MPGLTSGRAFSYITQMEENKKEEALNADKSRRQETGENKVSREEVREVLEEVRKELAEADRNADFDETFWPAKLFVTGIDTDAGKSYATGWLANFINANGGNAITMKFVQTGNHDFSEDILVHRKVMGIEPVNADLLHLTAPEIFSYPCSPELAARIDGREINFRLISEASDELARQYGTVIIEGAGGLMVPLKGDYLTIDYIKEHDLPTVLVTNSTLGSISHTLLTLQAMKHAGIKVFAVIYNAFFDKDKIIAEDTRNYIRHWLDTYFKDTLYFEMGQIKI